MPGDSGDGPTSEGLNDGDTARAAPGPTPPSRVLLVGFMASGKSAVGAELARALGWTFADVDRIIEAKSGRTIGSIFRLDGEPAFRRAEEAETKALLGEDRVVIAAGGGWAAVPGRLRGLPEGTLSVWLRVSAEAALLRARRQGVERPLLAGPDPLEEARRLLGEREPFYREAELSIEVEDRTVADIVRELRDRVTASDDKTNRTN